MWSIDTQIDSQTGASFYRVTDGRKHVLATADLAAAEAKLAELEAKLAARQAKVAAYGDRLQVTTQGLSRARAMRGARRYLVLDETDAVTAEYDSLDDVPELETAEDSDAAETEATTTAARGSITDAQIDAIWNLVQDGEGGGFVSGGPTTLDDIHAMDRADAALYLRSLKGDY